MPASWLDSLNPAQKEAVTHGDGPLLVIAGAGTGKTKTVEALAEILHGSEKNVLKVDCGEFQMEHGGGTTKGKSADSFAPIGPWLVTADEIPDPQALGLWTSVNGERRQHGSTRDMVFPVRHLVAYLSRFMSLLPGDQLLPNYQAALLGERSGSGGGTSAAVGRMLWISFAMAMGIALGTLQLPEAPIPEFRKSFEGLCEAFATARPTARNLFWAIERMQRLFAEALPSGIAAVKKALVDEAIAIGEEDIEINRRIGLNGKAFIGDGDNILTHCNAGALATAGFGTALGVVRAAREDGKNLHVFVDETRPVLQGARLTCWELQEDRIPATLITDNMAGFVMAQGKVNLVIVGADRIAANGDTANKIGTYSLAILAKEHGIPFYVAAPLSTIDRSIADGTGIPIEERHSDEVRHLHGVRTAPEKVEVYNPAFDVTPHRYITAIITEAGVAKRPFGPSIRKLFRSSDQRIEK